MTIRERINAIKALNNKQEMDKLYKGFPSYAKDISEVRLLRVLIIKADEAPSLTPSLTPSNTKELEELIKSNEAKELELKGRLKALELHEEEQRIKELELQSKKQELQDAQTELDIADELLTITNDLLVTKTKQVEINNLLIHIQTKLEEQYQRRRQALNMDRFFTQLQRREIYLRDGGKCKICGVAVTIDNYEADHIVAYSNGGATTADNGQCLCRSCNRQKGNN